MGEGCGSKPSVVCTRESLRMSDEEVEVLQKEIDITKIVDRNSLEVAEYCAGSEPVENSIYHS